MGILLNESCTKLGSALTLIGDIYFLLVLFIIMALTIVIMPGAEFLRDCRVSLLSCNFAMFFVFFPGIYFLL